MKPSVAPSRVDGHLVYGRVLGRPKEHRSRPSVLPGVEVNVAQLIAEERVRRVPEMGRNPHWIRGLHWRRALVVHRGKVAVN